MDGLFWLFEDEGLSRKAIQQRIKQGTLEDLQTMLKEGMKTRAATRQLDLSRALIFVLGNLDEAYKMSHNLNPDISADDLHDATARITVSDIKRALRKRFRNEQIARLGNNHLIYTSFTRAQFKELIRRELVRVSTFTQSRFGWQLQFTPAVIDIVYAEGVFPTQGTRPVFTTLKNLIESRIGRLALQILENNIAATDIQWHYLDDCFQYTIRNQTGEVVHLFSEKITLKIESLRKSTNLQVQAHTAVHEAGHAILAALTLRIVPSVVVSKTAADSCEGFCYINFPEGPMTKETLLKDLVITLGGYVAERLIFGDAYTSSGVQDDITMASELANSAIRRYAMGSDPIRLAVEDVDNEDLFKTSEKYAAEAVGLIKQCEKEAEVLLTRNKWLLLKMADHLTHHARMEEAEIGEFVKAYSAEAWVRTEGFIKKESYYQFYDQVKQQLSEYQKTGSALVMTGPQLV